MMRLACLSVLLLATPALAETDIRQLVIDTASGAGCVLTVDLAEATFPPLGLTEDDVGPVIEEMRLAGEVEVIDDVMHLSDDLCSGDTAAAEAAAPPQIAPEISPLMAKVIAVFQANGCSMTEDEGEPALAAAGISDEALDGLTPESEALMAAGLMLIDIETTVVTFVEPLCVAGPAPEGTAEAAPEAAPDAMADPADPLIRMLAENGCALTRGAAALLFDGYGITMEEADEMANSLMDRGLARIDGELLVLEACDG